jgi:hypothetical protein
MKTSMQELIVYLTEQLDKVIKEHPIEVNKDTYWRGVKIGLETTIALTELFIEKEKEQIMNAYDSGWSDGFDDKDLNAEYYNETFNINDRHH